MNKLSVIVTLVLTCALSGAAQNPAPAPAYVPPAPTAAPATPLPAGPAPSGTTTPTTSQIATQVTAQSPDYVIGPSDSLEITVFKEPTMSGTLPVRPDGMISLALVGDLQAAGLTPMHLSDSIKERLKKFINDPSVTVTVLGVNSKHIFLLGEVGKPGELPLTPGLGPLQAIASMGGLTQFANAKHIYILRTESGKQLKIPFNYKKAIKTGDQQGVTLAPGDTIVVP